ncbi:MAG: sigma-70 family RNA polymerase sigma factor [Lachnospiraceae bacterium]|nr:sigma-70 family RNA polymerase sigma factor [Lachnospiraceae bacterium]
MNKKQKEKYFNELYEKSYEGLSRFVQYRSSNPAFAEDILQEIYLEAFRHIEKLKEHENPRGWLYKAANYKILKLNAAYLRRQTHETRIEDWTQLPENPGSEQTEDFEEYKAILKEDEFSFLMMKYEQGYSHRELAKMTGSTEAGSKMKLSRILAKLRKGLSVLFF